jgi:hypothetical protein
MGIKSQKEPKMELALQVKAQKQYQLQREKLELAQQQALQKAWEYRDDPLYHRGWALRYYKYVEQEKALALELHAALEAA